jgi:hypothetical protein
VRPLGAPGAAVNRPWRAEAVAELEEVEPPGPDIIFDHLYASPRPWTLEEGLRDLREAKRRSGNSAT